MPATKTTPIKVVVNGIGKHPSSEVTDIVTSDDVSFVWNQALVLVATVYMKPFWDPGEGDKIGFHQHILTVYHWILRQIPSQSLPFLCWDCCHQEFQRVLLAFEEDEVRWVRFRLEMFFYFEMFTASVISNKTVCLIILQGTQISHLEKRNIIFKSALVRDILVPSRLAFLHFSISTWFSAK